MDIYLVQHAQALSEDQDPQRPLSDQGRRNTTKIAQYLAAKATELIDPPISAIYHSGKLRAQQTARIIAHAIAPAVTPNVLDNMNPKDDPNIIYHQLMADRERNQAIMFVGHLPHLARLAGLLLCQDAHKSPIQFTNAGILKIHPTENSWTLAWYLTPTCI